MKEHKIHSFKASQGWMTRLSARNNLSPSGIVQKTKSATWTKQCLLWAWMYEQANMLHSSKFPLSTMMERGANKHFPYLFQFVLRFFHCDVLVEFHWLHWTFGTKCHHRHITFCLYQAKSYQDSCLCGWNVRAVPAFAMYHLAPYVNCH